MKLYFIEPVFKTKPNNFQPVKIGYSKDVDRRLRELQTANFNELRVTLTIEVEDLKFARKIEKFFHRQFYRKQLYGEWFNLYGEHIKRIVDKFYSSHKKWIEDNYPNSH